MVWENGGCSYFCIEGEIVGGHGLIARDKSGKVFTNHQKAYLTIRTLLAIDSQNAHCYKQKAD